MPLNPLFKSLPAQPGIYRFLNKAGEILYIGKAKNIKKRIGQHFQKIKTTSAKNLKMLEQVADITWTITDNEIEALILENTLIKEHQPKYNILLRDDKNFLYIKISHETYPQISMVRRIADRKATYFGPYTSSMQIRASLTLIGKLFPYECLTFFKKGKTEKPCFNYHINRCPGLCIGVVSAEKYQHVIDEIKHFLRGDIEDIIARLEENMKEESAQRAFEKAAKIRDQMRALRGIDQQQKVLDPNHILSQDVIAVVPFDRNLYMSVLQIRRGVLRGQGNYIFRLPVAELQTENEWLEYVLPQYYEATTDIPAHIILADIGQEKKILEKWLTQKRGGKVEIIVPLQGKKNILLEMAYKNAEQYAEKETVAETAISGINPAMAVQELQRALSLKSPPRRIECYDISHLGGKFTVASMVVFQDGQPLKADYRQFHIQTVGDKIDDFQSMREALERRLKYLINPVFKKMLKDKKESFLKKPDLLMLDGGKGQLSIGVQVLSRLGWFKKLPIIALAKEQEDIFLPYEQQPLILAKDSQAQYLLERIRDEAHRFAITKNRKLRLKNQTVSSLDSIPGLGKTLKKRLLEKFQSVAGIRRASNAELTKVVGKKVAQALKEKL